MKSNKKVIAVMFALLVVSTGALVLASDDSDAASYTAKVYTPDGVLHTGTGSNLTGVITSVTGSASSDIEIAANGTITSYKGETAPAGKAWVLFQWIPMSDWTVTLFNSSGNAALVSGTSYAIHLSIITTSGGKTTYSQPSFKPTATAYFYIQFKEQYDMPYVQNLLTESQRKTGFWISGTGSDAADAFYNACQTYHFEVNMNMGDGTGSSGGSGYSTNLKGWLGSFMKMGDQQLPDQTWRYWVQYTWDGSKWDYNNSCLGYFDPNVMPYFAVIRQTTIVEGAASGLAITPSSVSVLSPSSAWDGEPGKYDTGPNTNVKVTGITLNTTNLSFFENGSNQKLTATISPSNATNKGVAWTSSNQSVATVDSDGNVKPLKEGNTVITVTTADGNKTAICSVTVKKQSSSGVFELASSAANVEVGKTVQLSANQIVTSWTSSDASVAKVDSSGKVTGVKVGTATITAASSSGTASCTVTVRAANTSDGNNGTATGDTNVFGNSTNSTANIPNLPSVAATGNPATLMTKDGKVEIPNAVLNGMSGADLTVKVENVDKNSDALNEKQKAKAKGADKIIDITAESSGTGIHVLGGKVKVTVTYTLPSSASVKDLSVSYLKEDGTMEKIDHDYKHSEKTLSFETNHFSLFVISTAAGSGSSGGLDSTTMIVIAAVLICIAAAAAAAVMLRRRSSAKAE